MLHLFTESVTFPNSASSTLSFSFSITGISPSTGSYIGGTEVTISGAGFIDGMAVTIGSATCDQVQVASDGASLTCVTSPHTVLHRVDNGGKHSCKCVHKLTIKPKEQRDQFLSASSKPTFLPATIYLTALHV